MVSDPDVPKRMRQCHLGCAGVGSVVGGAGYYARICHQLPEETSGRKIGGHLAALLDGSLRVASMTRFVTRNTGESCGVTRPVRATMVVKVLVEVRRDRIDHQEAS
jgi:hypothetical protein